MVLTLARLRTSVVDHSFGEIEHAIRASLLIAFVSCALCSEAASQDSGPVAESSSTRRSEAASESRPQGQTLVRGQLTDCRNLPISEQDILIHEVSKAGLPEEVGLTFDARTRTDGKGSFQLSMVGKRAGLFSIHRLTTSIRHGAMVTLSTDVDTHELGILREREGCLLAAGTVHDAKGVPLQNIRVEGGRLNAGFFQRLSSGYVWSDALGRYELLGPAEAAYDVVWIHGKSVEARGIRNHAELNRVPTIVSPATAVRGKVLSNTLAQLTVQLTESRPANLAPSIDIRFNPMRWFARTDVSGNFTLSPVPRNREYRLQVGVYGIPEPFWLHSQVIAVPGDGSHNADPDEVSIDLRGSVLSYAFSVRYDQKSIGFPGIYLSMSGDGSAPSWAFANCRFDGTADMLSPLPVTKLAVVAFGAVPKTVDVRAGRTDVELVPSRPRMVRLTVPRLRVHGDSTYVFSVCPASLPVPRLSAARCLKAVRYLGNSEPTRFEVSVPWEDQYWCDVWIQRQLPGGVLRRHVSARRTPSEALADIAVEFETDELAVGPSELAFGMPDVEFEDYQHNDRPGPP